MVGCRGWRAAVPIRPAEPQAEADADQVAGDGAEERDPAVQAGRGDAAEECTDVAAMGEAGAVTHQQAADGRSPALGAIGSPR